MGYPTAILFFSGIETMDLTGYGRSYHGDCLQCDQRSQFGFKKDGTAVRAVPSFVVLFDPVK